MTLKLISKSEPPKDETPQDDVGMARRGHQALLRIMSAEQCRASGSISPRTAQAAVGAFLGFIAPVVGMRLWAFAGLASAPFHITSLAFIATCVAVACVVAALILHFSRAATSNVEHLDRLLAEYEPMSKEAYRWLQDQVREAGAFRTGLVYEWASKEQAALNRAMSNAQPHDRKFLQRRL